MENKNLIGVINSLKRQYRLYSEIYRITGLNLDSIKEIKVDISQFELLLKKRLINNIQNEFDEITGRYLCDSNCSMPDEIPNGSFWHHADSYIVDEYTSYGINYIKYTCPNCDTSWVNES